MSFPETGGMYGLTVTSIGSNSWTISVANPPSNTAYYTVNYSQLNGISNPPTYVTSPFSDTNQYTPNPKTGPFTINFGILSSVLNMPSGYYYQVGVQAYDADNFLLGGLTYSSSSNLINFGAGGGGGGGGQPVCFLGNAPVLTPSGYKRIDSLAVGDMVRTATGRDVAIQHVKHQRVPAPSASVNPYVIPKGQFGATETLAISPRHCVAVPGRGMVEARELGLRQLSMKAAFDYYNLELPEWENMVVAGVEVESLAPKKRVVLTAAEFRALVAAQGIRTEADLAKLSRFVEMLADGRVALTLSKKARRF